MRSMFRTVLVASLAVFVLGAVAPGSAWAHEWKVNGSPLVGAREVTVAQSSKGFIMEAAGLVVARCEGVTGKGEVKEKGAGELTELKFTECSDYESPSCKVKSAGAPAVAGQIILLTTTSKAPPFEKEGGLLTGLTERETSSKTKVLADELRARSKNLWIELEYGNNENATTHKFTESCPGFSGLAAVEGQVAAEVKNLKGGEVELVFPEPTELRGNTLKWFGKAMSVFGSFKEALVGGGTLEGV